MTRRLAQLLAAVLVAAALAGCESVVEETNGPVGDAKIRTSVLPPPALYRKSSTYRRVEATPTAPASEEGACEGGVCSPK